MGTIITRAADPNGQATVDPTLKDAINICWSYVMMCRDYAALVSKFGDAAQQAITQDEMAKLLKRIQDLVDELTNGGSGTGGGGGGTIGGGGGGVITIGNGSPTEPGTTDGDVYWDSLNGKLWIWSNGQWVSIFDYFTPNAPAPVHIGQPSNPQEGDWYVDPTTHAIFYYHNGQWITATAALTPDTPAPVAISATFPSDPTEGQWFYNTADNKQYFYHSGSWLTPTQTYTPDATQAVAVVASLPTLPDTTYPDGAVVLNKGDAKLYKVVSGAWQLLALAMAPNVPNAVSIVTSLPALPDVAYPDNTVVFLTSNNTLYKVTTGAWVAIQQSISIAAGSITAGMIAAGAINTAQLAAGAVTANNLAANAVTAGKIAAGAVSADQIAAGAVTADKLAANSITAGKIAAGAITATQLAAGSVTADKMAIGAITAGMIQAGAVGTTQLAAGAITSDKLASNFAIIGSAQIAQATITTLNLAGNAVTVPVSMNDQSLHYGTGGPMTFGPINITMPQAGALSVRFDANQSYNGSIPDTTLILYLDGQLISGVQAGGGLGQVCIGAGGQRAVSAGSHTAYAVWTGNNAAVAIGNVCLSALSVMR